MSDILQKIDLNSVKQRITLSTDHCLHNSKKRFVNEDDIAVTITVPNEHLKRWYDLTAQGILTETYEEISNACILQYGVKLCQDERKESILRRSCGEINSQKGMLTGHANVKYMQKVKRICQASRG